MLEPSRMAVVGGVGGVGAAGGAGVLMVLAAGLSACSAGGEDGRWASAAGASAAAAADDLRPRAMLELHDVVHAGTARRFALFVPPAAGAGEGLPCIIFLHGRGECGTDGFRPCQVGLVAAAMSGPASSGWSRFVIIAPQKAEAAETWEENEGLVFACFEQAGRVLASRGLRIDPDRVYLTGLSQGGAGTWAIAARHPGVFAAIAPVCGFVHDPKTGTGRVGFGGEAARRAIAARLATEKTPVWAFHGERDDVVPPEHTRAMIEAIEQAGGGGAGGGGGGGGARVRATYFAEANHNAWDPAYRQTRLAEWLWRHRRRAAEP